MIFPDNTQKALRENNMISPMEIAMQEGDLIVAENVITKERRMLLRENVMQHISVNNITESAEKTRLLKG
jgi:hypothetical protein